ncbi:MAG: 30S ribosomal protein S4 [bacterium]|nr:30S ribosomal protein S4 [bacterium]
MKLGPKYKIARRLGAPIFEKTQTAKFAQSLARKEKNVRTRQKPKSEFGLQLIEKQKARFTYGISEKQFSKYAKTALSAGDPTQKLYTSLELRLDNFLYRAGFAKTRAQARQMASHGHSQINNKRVTIPSIHLKDGDVINVREGSKKSVLFVDMAERIKSLAPSSWLEVNGDKGEAKVTGRPVYMPAEHVFDLGVVLEFYSR